MGLCITRAGAEETSLPQHLPLVPSDTTKSESSCFKFLKRAQYWRHAATCTDLSQECIQVPGGTKNVNLCTATVGNLSKTVASLWLTLLRQQRGDFCKYIFFLCALAVKLIQGAFMTTAQEEDAQRAGDSRWPPTATDLESLSPAGLTFGTGERRNWKFGRLCRVSVGMKRRLNDS